MCISGSTVAQCPDHFFRPVGALVLKGKTESIDAFEPITEEESKTEWVHRYTEAFEHLAREADDTREMFAALLEDYPGDPLVNLHYDRIMEGTLSSTIVLGEK